MSKKSLKRIEVRKLIEKYGIEKLCEELPNSQITHLNISECNIGAEGLKLLCDILS